MTAGLSSPEPEDGGTVERDAAFLPDGVTPGATNLSDPGPSTPGAVQAGRDEMVAEVARAFGAAGVSPFEIEDWRIADFADRLRRAGFRRVAEDDDTVELVARALFGDFDGVVDGMSWGEDSERSREGYRGRARAAVRALREETGPAQTHHACCPHCTAKTGSCVRCGVRDAFGEGGYALCEECDVEVTAEVAGGSAALREETP